MIYVPGSSLIVFTAINCPEDFTLACGGVSYKTTQLKVHKVDTETNHDSGYGGIARNRI